MQWVVQIDIEEQKKGFDAWAQLVGMYYQAVLGATGDKELAVALTVDYQRMLLQPILAKQVSR